MKKLSKNKSKKKTVKKVFMIKYKKSVKKYNKILRKKINSINYKTMCLLHTRNLINQKENNKNCLKIYKKIQTTILWLPKKEKKLSDTAGSAKFFNLIEFVIVMNVKSVFAHLIIIVLGWKTVLERKIEILFGFICSFNFYNFLWFLLTLVAKH